ncbi:MAG: chemotaxis response regulator protein-glutamate methylesterase [Alphaproteobacteria bacterium]|nr:chemotaxis response regulator protein-glutamate methylesterase [Alphaproteobacteria bacterium]
MSAVRVLVVDDSATMRHMVADCLGADRGIEVVGFAANANAAREAIKQLNPDVMTLDVEMPEMDGLAFLEKVMRLRPMPVVMVSTLTSRGSDTAISALALGAVDCVAKPSPANPDSFEELPQKVKLAANVTRLRRPDVVPVRKAAGSYVPSDRIVAIGSSTGGVEALIAVLSSYPPNCPPTVITQHMPAHFTASFAQRLNRMCAPTVAEAHQGAPLVAGRVYVAPGGTQHLEVGGQRVLTCTLRAGQPVNGHCPSVDVLFNSVARAAGGKALGVILTGMGRDGAKGLLAMRHAGCRTIGQDAATSIVYGMPKAAHEIGAVGSQLALDAIGPEILSATNIYR